MAPEDNNGTRPAGPVVLRVKLRYDDLDAMVQRFAPNVGKSGLFLPTKAMQPVGTEVKFELRLANDTPVLVGLGRVKEVRAPNPDDPRLAYGISIALMRVSREGREVIMRMLDRRRELGLPEVVIPLPDDIDAARRIGPDGLVRDSAPRIASSPVIEATPPPAPGGPGREGHPLAVIERPSSPLETPPHPLPVIERPSSPLETPPHPLPAIERRSSPIVAIAELPPERQRAARPRLAELIDRAAELSGPLGAASPDLDEQVDVERALARARALAGSDLDGELAALGELSAAPLAEISIEAASAELARQLGGKPISQRDRRVRRGAPVGVEATPPPIVESTLLPIVDSIPPLIVEATPPPIVESTQLLVEATPPPIVEATPPPMIEAPRGGGRPGTIEQTLDSEFAAKTRAQTESAPSAAIAAATDAAIASQEEQQSPSIVPRESYVIRKSDRFDSPYVEPYEGEGRYDDTGPLTDQEQALTPPVATPAVEEDPELAAFEAALDAARIHTGVTTPAPPADDDNEEEEQDEPAARLADAPAYDAAEEDDDDVEELDDMDVLEIADDDDEEDEHTVAQAAPVEAAGEAPPPAADDDFASRLDLGDDDPPEGANEERGAGYGAPRYHGLQFRPHESGEEFDEPHQYAPAHDLEQALSALDVDLDPSLSQHSRPRASSPQTRFREPTGPPKGGPSGQGSLAPRTREDRSPSGPAPQPSGRTRFREPTGPAPAPSGRTRFRDPTGPPPPPSAPPPRTREPSRPPSREPSGRVSSGSAMRPLPGLPLHRPVTDESPTVAKRRAETDDGIMIDFDDDE